MVKLKDVIIKEEKFKPYPKLKKFDIKSKGEIKDFSPFVDMFAERLKKFEDSGNLQIGIDVENKLNFWNFDISEKECKPKSGTVDKPRLELKMKGSTARKLLDGTFSPIEALGRGELVIKGDIKFGIRLYKHLAAEKGRYAPC